MQVIAEAKHRDPPFGRCAKLGRQSSYEHETTDNRSVLTRVVMGVKEGDDVVVEEVAN